MKTLLNSTAQPVVPLEDRNQVAAYLSIVPGLGHLYKHHYLLGFGILTAGNLFAAFVTSLLALATFGFALVLVPVFYLAMVATSAYCIEDWHHRHTTL